MKSFLRAQAIQWLFSNGIIARRTCRPRFSDAIQYALDLSDSIVLTHVSEDELVFTTFPVGRSIHPGKRLQKLVAPFYALTAFRRSTSAQRPDKVGRNSGRHKKIRAFTGRHMAGDPIALSIAKIDDVIAGSIGHLESEAGDREIKLTGVYDGYLYEVLVHFDRVAMAHNALASSNRKPRAHMVLTHKIKSIDDTKDKPGASQQ